MIPSALTAWFAALNAWETALVAAGALLLVLGFVYLVLRARKPSIVVIRGEPAQLAKGVCARVGGRLRALWEALDYLATRREWRYEQPWVLLLGNQEAGKSSLAASVSETWRHPAPACADQLKVDGMQWRFFRQGVLIDAEGKLSAAEAGSEEAQAWSKALGGLTALRPERPIDGILLCVSARALLEGTRAQRAAMAATVNRQLGELQERIEFALPVNVVVTQCDSIPGFGAFWRCLPARAREMFGYSAGALDQSAQPGEWAETAFSVIAARLSSLQIEVAAHQARVQDVDDFFLFPSRFCRLRAPLANWLETVFRATAWQSGHLFRGLYFTGSVTADGARALAPREDVGFIDSLVNDKALREGGIARPTRQGIWSRNRLIRSMQIGAVGSLALLLCALGVAAVRLDRQVDNLVNAIAALDRATPVAARDAGCLGGDLVYPVLRDVAQVRADSLYLAIPASWVDRRLSHRSADHIGTTAVGRVLMPSLSCNLERRARQLIGNTQDIAEAGEDFAARQAAFFKYVADIRELEINLERFRTLAWKAHEEDEEALLETVFDLAAYAYEMEPPAEIRRTHSVLDESLATLSEKADPRRPQSWQMVVLPSTYKDFLAKQIDTRATQLHEALGKEVDRGATLLSALVEGREPVLENTRHFAHWLGWTRASWLAGGDGKDPCDAVRDGIREGVVELQNDRGYSARLQTTLDRFNDTSCGQPLLNRLTRMTQAPYGMVFTGSKSGGWDLAPSLRGELAGLPQLVTLGFMRLQEPKRFACVGNAAQWRRLEIREAAGYLQDYQNFAKSQKLSADPAAPRPLYDRLARGALERALGDAMHRAQQLPAAPASAQIGLDAISRADSELSRSAGEMGQSLDPLKRVLQAYVDYGFDGGGAALRQCVTDYAADQLGQVSALAANSRLYAPQAALAGDHLFDLNAVPVTKDYLARQVARAQVLVGYAAPYVNLMQAVAPVNEAQRDGDRSQDFWSNTAAELNRYQQAKEPSGQVAALDSFFLRQLTGLGYAGCAKTLDAYTPPELGNDLFSDRRAQLEQQVALQCGDRAQAQAYELYRTWAGRFNRELAGRYPFAEPGAAREAAPATVRAFFADYMAQRAALRDALASLPKKEWGDFQRFAAQLDAVADFFAGNLLASETGEPIKLTLAFNAHPAASSGADQLVAWQLAAGNARAGFPNQPTTLDWVVGQPLSLTLSWADRSGWLPQADPAQPELQVRERRAAFTSGSPWSLLRWIAARRPLAGPETDPANPRLRLLEFTLPLAGAAGADGKAAQGRARLFLGVGLSATDPKTQAAQALKLPGFPRLAPTE